MKQHIIPYDVMDVDFKLFGFMNVKQFVYVAVGVVMGYIIYAMSSRGEIPALIGMPLAFIIVVGGVSLGLLKVQGRSVDEWILSFFMAISNPTKRAWKKEGVTPKVIPSTIPVVQMKPPQIKIDGNITVDKIIGNLNVPSPVLEDSGPVSNIDKTAPSKIMAPQYSITQGYDKSVSVQNKTMNNANTRVSSQQGTNNIQQPVTQQVQSNVLPQQPAGGVNLSNNIVNTLTEGDVESNLRGQINLDNTAKTNG